MVLCSIKGAFRWTLDGLIPYSRFIFVLLLLCAVVAVSVQAQVQYQYPFYPYVNTFPYYNGNYFHIGLPTGTATGAGVSGLPAQFQPQPQLYNVYVPSVAEIPVQLASPATVPVPVQPEIVSPANSHGGHYEIYEYGRENTDSAPLDLVPVPEGLVRIIRQLGGGLGLGPVLARFNRPFQVFQHQGHYEKYFYGRGGLTF